MKLISIEMSAFGPFKGREFIDFTKYDNEKIFLISGKTGSGKTTIFDAISYALFGKMTGEYRNESSIRSHYASKDVDTYVKLLFEKDNKRYEVYRKPSYHVEGRKTKVIGESVFSIVSPTQKVLGEKTNIINPLIEDIIGFKYAQFKQIVVLPQGEFIKILNSKSNEKEVLLSSILDTHIYLALTEKVKEDFNELYKKIGTVQNQLDIILNNHSVSNEQELEELKDKKEKEIKDILKVVSDFDEKVKNLDLEIRKHEENNKNLSVLKELNINKQTLLDNNKDIEERRKLLKKLKTLSSIKGYKDNLEKDKIQLKEEEEKIKVLNEELNNSKLEYDKIEQYKIQLKTLNEENDKVKEYSAVLKNLENDKTKIEENKVVINNIDKEIASIDLRKDNLGKEKEQLLVNKASVKEDLEVKNKFVNEYDIDEYSRAKDLYNRYQSRISLIEKIEANQEALKVIKNNLEKEEKELENLEVKEKEWKNINKNNTLQAYIAELEEGKECPLCGSIHHPHILEKIENFISDIELENLSKEIKNKLNSINEIKTQKSLFESRIEDGKKDELYLLDMSKEEEVKNKYEKLSNDNSKANEYKLSIINLKEKLDLLDDSIKNKEELIFNSNAQLASKNERKSILSKEVNDLEDKLIKELKGKELDVLKIENEKSIKALNEKIDALNEKISTATLNYNSLSQKLDSSIEKKKELEKNIESNKEKIDNSLKFNNLTEEELNNSISRLEELSELEKNIDSYDKEITKLDASIETYKNLITNNEYVDCSELKLKLEELKGKYNEENAKFNELNEVYVIVKNDYDRYISQSLSIASSKEKYKMIAKLNNLCSGTLSGSKKISLHKFVLMKLLDEILKYANKYLLNFSSSRYSLVREENGGASDKGLDLNVFDEHTGYARPVSSLSGGESFMSALALAIGMSEFIMNMHGGIKMDNIFVDEGFGSLDGESLNNAIETLMQLAANGRMIGIISHIDSIKQMIPQSIEIVKMKTGSTINTI